MWSPLLNSIGGNRVNAHPHGGAPTNGIYGCFMPFDPKIQHRHSIRLKDYDYSQSGAYFITLCSHNKELLFEPAPVQEMLKFFWEKLPTKCQVVQLDEFVIMPNHIHGIIVMVGRPGGVAYTALGNVVDWYKTMATNAYIHGVKDNQWSPFNQRFWQRNYYDHIIRNEDDLNHIRQYIIDNPDKWAGDENNPEWVGTRGANRHLHEGTDTK